MLGDDSGWCWLEEPLVLRMEFLSFSVLHHKDLPSTVGKPLNQSWLHRM